MSNFINKHFRKSKCIKVIYFGEGKRNDIHYIIPKGSTITINEKSFVLNNNDFFIDRKNFVTFIFSHQRVEPINPNDVENLGEYDPALFDIALNSRIASEILDASKNKADINIFLMVGLFIMIVGFAVVWYTLSEQISALQESLKPLLEVLQ